MKDFKFWFYLFLFAFAMHYIAPGYYGTVLTWVIVGTFGGSHEMAMGQRKHNKENKK